MQIRMNPRARRIVDILRNFVRGIPLIPGIVPERPQWSG